jgi:hypothetical protein
MTRSKLAAALLAVLAPLAAVGQPALDAVHDVHGELIMALDDDGVLHELTREGWLTVGEPCPTAGPYSLQLLKLPGYDTTAFIFVIDGVGRIYQTDSTAWLELQSPPAAAEAPCLGELFNPTAGGVDTLLVDAGGALFVNEGEASWRSVEATLPGTPRDLEVFFEGATLTANPFVLADDNRLYGFVDEAWQPSETFGAAARLNRLELHVDDETGGVLLLSVDENGRIYDNNATGELAPTDHEPCPGDGPWELKLFFVDGGFDLLCLDSAGRLYQALDGSWNQVCDPFPSTDSE